MRNKLWVMLTLLLVATLVLAACGSSTPAAQEEPTEEAMPEDEASEDAADEADEEPAEEPAAEEAEDAADEEAMGETDEAAEAETVAEEPAADEAEDEAMVDGPTLTIWADEVSAPVLDGMSGDFASENGINIVVVQKGFDDLRNDYKIAASAGEGPDILLGAHDWLGEFNASGLLAEVSLGNKVEQFAPVAVDAFTFTDGKLYGMPVSMENVAFYYNTDLVEEAPATWDEVKELSAALQADGNKYGYLVQANDPYHFYPIQTAFGGYVFGKTDEGAWNPEDVGLNSEGTIAAFEWLDSLYKDGILEPGANIDGGLMLSAFQNGDAAMVISGPWALGGFREAGVPYAIAPIPAAEQPGKPFLGVRGFMVNPFSENQLLAQTFLQQIVANEDTLKQIYDNDPRPSAFLPLAELMGRFGPSFVHGSWHGWRSHAQHSRNELGVAGLGRCNGTDQQPDADSTGSAGQCSVAG